MTQKKLFYENGLRFQCTRCSKCCRLTPGFVFLSADDLKGIAGIIKLSTEEVVSRYCRVINIGGFKRLSLIEKSNYDCIFWEDTGCRIYAGRPLQCRSYPFWQSNLESIEAWENVSAKCPGTGKGKKHNRKTIEYWLEMRRTERLLVPE